jgi:hypothetical protein
VRQQVDAMQEYFADAAKMLQTIVDAPPPAPK